MGVGAMSKDDDGALHEVYKALKCFSVEELYLIHTSLVRNLKGCDCAPLNIYTYDSYMFVYMMKTF